MQGHRQLLAPERLQQEAVVLLECPQEQWSVKAGTGLSLSGTVPSVGDATLAASLSVCSFEGRHGVIFFGVGVGEWHSVSSVHTSSLFGTVVGVSVLADMEIFVVLQKVHDGPVHTPMYTGSRFESGNSPGSSGIRGKVGDDVSSMIGVCMTAARQRRMVVTKRHTMKV